MRFHEAYEEQLYKVFLTTSANFKISEKSAGCQVALQVMQVLETRKINGS